jgi:hypothetical protein
MTRCYRDNLGHSVALGYGVTAGGKGTTSTYIVAVLCLCKPCLACWGYLHRDMGMDRGASVLFASSEVLAAGHMHARAVAHRVQVQHTRGFLVVLVP